jgi:RimJ/RimL family protein N-acetyltransferase
VDDDAVLVTERLALRHWRADDVEPMAAINRDPEVVRYLNRPTDDATIDAFVDRVLAHWAEPSDVWRTVTP